MIHIKNFINKMSIMESKQSKDVVLPMTDARGLRDDISRLLTDLHEMTKEEAVKKNEEINKINIAGGSFK